MAQHLWVPIGPGRLCADCRAMQVERDGEWQPPVYPICPGDPDDGHAGGGGRTPDSPAPAGQLVLEFA